MCSWVSQISLPAGELLPKVALLSGDLCPCSVVGSISLTIGKSSTIPCPMIKPLCKKPLCKTFEHCFSKMYPMSHDSAYLSKSRSNTLVLRSSIQPQYYQGNSHHGKEGWQHACDALVLTHFVAYLFLPYLFSYLRTSEIWLVMRRSPVKNGRVPNSNIMGSMLLSSACEQTQRQGDCESKSQPGGIILLQGIPRRRILKFKSSWSKSSIP